jgi:hypothetical protein
MIMEPLTPECVQNERPLQPIKSFSQINFQHESLLTERFEMERMDNFLSNDDVIRNSSSLNKSMLRMMYVVWQLMLNPIG